MRTTYPISAKEDIYIRDTTEHKRGPTECVEAIKKSGGAANMAAKAPSKTPERAG